MIEKTKEEIEKQVKAEFEVRQYINQYSFNENATDDLMESIIVEVFKYQGQEKTIIKDRKTQAILSNEEMIDKWKKEKPMYLDLEKHKVSTAAQINAAIAANAAYQKEKDDLQRQVNQAVADGNMDLFRELRKKQGAKLK